MDCILGPIRIVYNMSRPAIALISHAGVVWSRVLILQPLTILFSYFFPDGMVSRALHFLLTYTSPTLSSSSGKPQPWYTYVDVALGWKWTTIPVRNSTLRAWLRDHGDWSWEDESDTDRILALCFSYGTLALIILLFTALYSYFPPAQGTQRRQPGGAEAFVAQDQGFLAQDMEGEEEEEDPERRLGREAEEWLRAGEEEAGEDMFFGLVGEAERGALRVAGLMLKVAIFVAIELVLFPLACGLLLSALSMPLLHGATLEGRLSFAHRAPLACLFLHWTVGTAFMFGFASMVGALRSLLRPGVLYFIRDPKDTGFSPLREILERPAVYQLRKIGLSFHMYAVVMLLGVCAIMVPGYLGQYLGLPTSLCALPLRWDPRPLSFSSNPDPSAETTSPDWWMGRFPLDLLILQAIVPLAILAKPLKWIFPVLKAWLRWFASVNSLSSFFFGVPGVHLCSRALRNPGSCRTCRSLEVRWGMEVVLVPRRDGIPLPRLRPGVGEDDGVVRRRPRRGQELQEGEGTAWAETKDYQFVYVPPNLKRRIVFVILGSWVFIASLVTLLFLLPVTIGRYSLTIIINSNQVTNDLHSFLLGYAIVYSCGRLVARLISWNRAPKPESSSVENRTPMVKETNEENKGATGETTPVRNDQDEEEEKEMKKDEMAPLGEEALQGSMDPARDQRDAHKSRFYKGYQALLRLRRFIWCAAITLGALLIYGLILPILLGMTGKILISGLIGLVRPASASALLHQIILGQRVTGEGPFSRSALLAAELAQSWALGLLYAKMALQVFLLLRGRRAFAEEGGRREQDQRPEMEGVIVQLVAPAEPGVGVRVRNGRALQAREDARDRQPARERRGNEVLGESLVKLWQLPLDILAPMLEKNEEYIVLDAEGVGEEEMEEAGVAVVAEENAEGESGNRETQTFLPGRMKVRMIRRLRGFERLERSLTLWAIPLVVSLWLFLSLPILSLAFLSRRQSKLSWREKREKR